MCRLLLIALGLFSCAQVLCAETTLKDFSTDGCSMWLDGTLIHKNIWRECCVAHDQAYWIGGTAEERKKADQALQVCVKNAYGEGMADYMYDMVRWGGHPLWVTPYRWGYGWSYFDGASPRGYKPLSEEEQKEVEKKLPAMQKKIEEELLKHPVKN